MSEFCSFMTSSVVSGRRDAERQLQAFGFGFGPEETKGQPKSVRVERRDLRAGTGSAGDHRYLVETREYNATGTRVERCFYRPDARLSHREVYEYSGDGCFLRSVGYDSAGTKLQESRSVPSNDARIREIVVLGPSGEEQERTVTKLDDRGRVSESTITGISQNTRLHLSILYDSEGRPIRADFTFQGQSELGLRLQNVYDTSGSVLTTWYRLTGESMSEGRISAVAPDYSQIMASHSGLRIAERVDSRDEKGNWTEKTVLKGTLPDEDLQPEATIYRSITYYEPDRTEARST